MRIISGRLGGRRIKTVEGEGYRPAMGKTRESLFSMLTSRGVVWEGARVLDLFRRQRQPGLRSREPRRRAGRAGGELRRGRPLPGRQHPPAGRGGLRAPDPRRRAQDPEQYAHGCFDLVFLDPPYRKNLLNATLQGLLKRNWLAPGALICAEIEKDAVVAAPDSLELLVERHFGQTRILIWTLA